MNKSIIIRSKKELANMTQESRDRYYSRKSIKHSSDMCWYCWIWFAGLAIIALVSSCGAEILHGIRSFL
jgi:hypothetical protein